MYNYEYKNEKWFDSSEIYNLKFNSLIQNKLHIFGFKYTVGTHIVDDHRDIIIVENKRNDKSGRKQCKIHCNICGFDSRKISYKNGEEYDHWISESRISNGDGCPCCNNGIVVQPGINDIATLNEYTTSVIGEEMAKRYSPYSGVIIHNPVCPSCHQTLKKDIAISSISVNNSIGCTCGKGISVINKMIHWIFWKKAGDSNPEKTKPEWIVPNCTIKNGHPERYRYDNYSEKYKVVCEGMSTLGHEGGRAYPGSSLEESIERDRIKKISVPDDWTYIDVWITDTTYKLKNVKKSFLESGLFEALNIKMKNEDWINMMKYAFKNIPEEVCKYFNEYMTVKEVSEKFCLSETIIRNYLKRGTEIGWCNYLSRYNRNTFLPCFVSRDYYYVKYHNLSEAARDIGVTNDQTIKNWCVKHTCFSNGVWCFENEIEKIPIQEIP